MKYFLLLFTASTLSAQPSPVLGKIGDIEIETREIRESLAGLETGQGSSFSGNPAAVNQYVRAILVQRLLLQQALEEKFDQDPKVIAKLVRIREAALTDAYLESFSTPPADFPSDKETTAAYEATKPTLGIPKGFRIAQIFVATSDDAEKKIGEISKKLKAKETGFAELARSSSEESNSAKNGGEIGWVTEAQVQPEIREKLTKLSVNDITEPVKLQDGWHVIKLLETRAASTATLDQVRPQLIAKLRADRSKQLRQEFVAKLIEKNPIAINEIELAGIVPKPVSQTVAPNSSAP